MSDSIQVWTHAIQDFDDPYYEWNLKKLDADFIKKVEAYRFVKDRVKKTAGRLMLQKLFAQSGGKGSLSDLLQKGTYNKPFINDWYTFSLSYSEKLVVLAFHASGRLGVDVEYKKEFDYEPMLTQFHPNERIRIAMQPQPLDAFYHIWVKKEAVLKAEGTGLVDELFQIDCSENVNHSFEAPLYLKSLNIKEKYVCYVASDSLHENVDVIELTQQELTA